MKRTSLRACLVAAVAAAGLAAAPAYAAEAQLDRIVSANPENWTPNVNDGRVNAVIQVGNRMIAVGKFTNVTQGGVTVTRNNIFAYDATTGAVDPAFVPNVGTAEVFDVVDAGDGTVFIGGSFSSVNGAANTSRVAKINATTGAVNTTFRSPRPNVGLTDMQLSGGKLYIGGGFSTLAGVPRSILAAIDPTTGADTGSVAFTFTEPWNGGALGIKHFDISDDGSKLVAVGNWRTVNGQSRPQIMMADLTGATAALSTWSTQRFTTTCASVFDTYLRDVDIAPSGDYFVTAATGAYAGGVSSGTLCDSIARFDITTAANSHPAWVDYSGGDTLTQVKVVGDVVYVGGHMRWLNNPFAGDAAGAGAVSRAGLAAVDPRNGLPFSWNPTRARGVGVWDFMTTDAGLWVAHDTNTTGKETRKRIALFPAAGGTTLPAENTGSLPGHVQLLGQPAAVTTGHWVARVNAAGPSLLASDSGPNWLADNSDPSPYRNNGSTPADWGGISIARGSALPASAPTALFNTERYSPGGTEMNWAFPAPSGHNLTVRLYFSNGYDGTSLPGQRVFDVRIDDNLVLDDYDISADVGHRTGTMKQFTITSDGNVDIDFAHVTENPLVNGIEIIDNDVPAPGVGANDTVIDRSFDGTSVASSSVVGNGGQVWSQSRGATMIDGVLYTGWSDGTLKARTYNGTTFGAATTVSLNGLTEFAGELPNLTGMFYDKATARLYYTLSGQSKLFYRYFLPESRIVGAVRFEAGVNGNGIDWAKASGLFLDGANLFVGDSATGELRSVGWSGGALQGTATVVSGPGVDGNDWRARGTFILAP